VAGDPEVETWAAAAGEAWQMEDGVFSSIAPTRSPQGVLAIVSEPQFPPWKAATGVGVWLDTVQDPGNLGAVVRCAAALDVAAVLLSPECADPYGPAAVRGSAAAGLRIPVERGVTAPEVVERVRSAGGEVWATGAAGIDLARWSPAAPTLLMLGAEGRGLEPTTVQLADGSVTIPLARGVESLNVAVAAGILLERLRG
jgi:TrmH family RNA methyltransferase